MNFNLEVFDKLWLLCMKNHKQRNSWAEAAGVVPQTISQLKAAYLKEQGHDVESTRKHLTLGLLNKLVIGLLKIGVSKQDVRSLLLFLARKEADSSKSINLLLAILPEDEKKRICEFMGI